MHPPWALRPPGPDKETYSIVKPLMVRSPNDLNTRKLPRPPLTATCVLPGPLIVTPPVVSVMLSAMGPIGQGPSALHFEKSDIAVRLIVSPLWRLTLVAAQRKVPLEPSSSHLVTCQ